MWCRAAKRAQTMRVLRFANRVPLLYQQGACAVLESIVDTAWRNYGISQSRGSIPSGPIVLAVHLASVWVPFTSESKEAIAHYDVIIKEMKLAIQEAGRRVASFLRRRQRLTRQLQRRSIFERYIEEVAEACDTLAGVNRKKLMKQLQEMAIRVTKIEEKKARKEVSPDDFLRGTTSLVVPENAPRDEEE